MIWAWEQITIMIVKTKIIYFTDKVVKLDLWKLDMAFHLSGIRKRLCLKVWLSSLSFKVISYLSFTGWLVFPSLSPLLCLLPWPAESILLHLYSYNTLYMSSLKKKVLKIDECKGGFSTSKSTHVISYLIITKEKIHMVISADTEKAIDKIQQPFMIKTFGKLGKEGNSLNIIKGIYEEPTANIKHNGERLSFPLRWETRQTWHFYLCYSSLYWKFQPGKSDKKNK